MMNTNLLKSYIVRYDRIQKNLADAMGISLSRLNAKINECDGAEFTQSEISFMAQRYGLSSADIEAVFFARKVS